MARVLVVDDEKKMVTLLVSALKARGHEVTGVHGGQEALALLEASDWDVVLTDLKMEPVGGLQVVEQVQARHPGTQAIMLTAYGQVETAVAAMQAGAFHYLTKPINFQEVAEVVDRAAETGRLQRENRHLKQAVALMNAGSNLVGQAPATEELRAMIAKVAPADATVLIRGESGSGKEVAARAVHEASGRAHGPFVAVNCAAISETLLESELFGYRKGAFTGADSDRQGVFEAADGGTLFLDEIGEAGPGVQAKLLRVLEEKKINRVGDPVERAVNVRVLAATNRPLEQEVARGRFRQDLYYRLLVFPLDVPPLRERADDIPLLAGHFLQRLGRRQAGLPHGVVQQLRRHAWPGNVRELRNIMERAHILAGDAPIGPEHVRLDGALVTGGGAGAGANLNLDDNARLLIEAALQRAGGNKSLAAEMLGITRRTLYSRLKLLDMETGEKTGQEDPGAD